MLFPNRRSISSQVTLAESMFPSGLMPRMIKFFNSSCPSRAEPRAFNISKIVQASSSEDAIMSTYKSLSVIAERSASKNCVGESLECCISS